MLWSHASRVTFSVDRRDDMPTTAALLTRMWIVPWSWRMLLAVACSFGRSVTSQWWKIGVLMGGLPWVSASLDSETIWSIVACAEDFEMSRKITWQPCREKSSTVAAPMPSAPPVTRTFLLRRLG